MSSQPPQEQLGAYVLSFQDVAEVLKAVNLGQLITKLADQIEAVYRDREVEPVKRLGWSKPPDALEIMGCQADDYTCVKLISSVPAINGSPTVTGTLVCTDRETDQARLVCDAAFLTPLRTAATSAVVMRQVAPQASSLGIVGAGLEGIAHAVALTCIAKSIETIRLLDIDPAQADKAAQEVRYLLDRDDLLVQRSIQIETCEAEQDLYESDVLVTATFAEHDSDVLQETASIQDGTFVAAVGADLKKKRELPDQLYDRAKFVADDLQQCLEDGELQYAKEGRCSTSEEGQITDHRGNLGDGRILSVADFLPNPRPFLERSEKITIYDSAGFSGQDLAVARVLLGLLEESGDLKRQSWNPPGSRSLVDLLGCGPRGE